MTAKKKILLGGVPFGRNNVGDEAILECVVRIVRDALPDADITVSTDDGPATAEKLKVKTVELFGFEPPFSRERMKKTLQEHDVFIWSGATGLSDYPEIPIEMLRIAQEAGRKTVLWGVGMNHNLNPVKYTVLPGKRRTVLKLLSACSLGLVDAVALEEDRREKRARDKIATRLSAADLVVVRDPESKAEIARCGDGPNVIVGADSAIVLDEAKLEDVKLEDDVLAVLNDDRKKVGFCVSAQREIKNRDKLIDYFNRLIENDEVRLVFIPMNPVTDSALMKELQQQLEQPDRSVVVEGRFEPDEILAVAARMDVIASSRLHLLILASIVHVPIIGVSRGSKVDNFLRPFGLRSVGSVENLDFERLQNETRRLLKEKEPFQEISRKVRKDLLGRLESAKELLKEAFA